MQFLNISENYSVEVFPDVCGNLTLLETRRSFVLKYNPPTKMNTYQLQGTANVQKHSIRKLLISTVNLLQVLDAECVTVKLIGTKAAQLIEI